MAKETLTKEGKFKRLVYILGEPAPHVIGHLELMWHSAWASLSPTFRDSIDVEAAAEWDGEPGALTTALVECRFLDELPDGLAVHGYWNHAPMSVKQRAARAGIDWQAAKAEESSRQPGGNRAATGRQPDGNLPVQTSPDQSSPTGGVGVARKPPSIDDVRAYAAEYMESKGFQGADPTDRFYDHFCSNGWRVSGKAPMKDWRASLRNWIRNDVDRGKLLPAGGPSGDGWVLDTYRKTDHDRHRRDKAWPMYLEMAADLPPRTAPSFDDWRNGRETP